MNKTEKPALKKFHTPVLLKESLSFLNIKPDGVYIDGTLGEAGHSIEILKRLEDGTLISLDQDEEAIEFVKKKYRKGIEKHNWIIEKSNFRNLKTVLQKLKIEKVDGILLDIGISSRQLEKTDRGFSYVEDEQELDMRMDKETNWKASDLLKVLNEYELTKLLRTYGEEKHASRIAKIIKEELNKGTDIETVKDLKKVVYKALPAKNLINQKALKKEPARRVFQALRVAINDELNSLSQALEDGTELLKSKGRFVVISFHSLEDRIVKQHFKQLEEKGIATRLTDKPVTPDKHELDANPRSSSAKLRTIEKI